MRALIIIVTERKYLIVWRFIRQLIDAQAID